MLLNELAQYLNNVEATVRGIKDAYIERYEEEILSLDRVNLRIRIRFSNGNLLELNEAITLENRQINHLGYRYHFQDQKNQLIFRYDDTPHFPNLSSFPHHKHTTTQVHATTKPSIIEAIAESVGLN